MNPNRPSRASWLAVKPSRTSLADTTPARAASPAWKGLVMVPKFCRSPDAWDAASEMVMAVRSASRPIILLAAAADPTAPKGPVGCHPRSS